MRFLRWAGIFATMGVIATTAGLSPVFAAPTGSLTITQSEFKGAVSRIVIKGEANGEDLKVMLTDTSTVTTNPSSFVFDTPTGGSLDATKKILTIPAGNIDVGVNVKTTTPPVTQELVSGTISTTLDPTCQQAGMCTTVKESGVTFRVSQRPVVDASRPREYVVIASPTHPGAGSHAVSTYIHKNSALGKLTVTPSVGTATLKDEGLYVYGKNREYTQWSGFDIPAGSSAFLSASASVPVRKKAVSVECDTGGGSCIIITDQGEAYGIGSNYKGKLGLGSTDTTAFPTQITLPSGEKAKKAIHTVFYNAILTESGRIYVAGEDPGYYLGADKKGFLWGSSTIQGTPQTTFKVVSGISSVTDIAASNLGVTMLAVTSSGYGYYWGGGVGNLNDVSSPTRITGLNRVKKVSGDHIGYSPKGTGYQGGNSYWLDDSGTVWGVGPDSGGTSNGSSGPYSSTMTYPSRELVSSGNTGMLLTNDGSIYGWGVAKYQAASYETPVNSPINLTGSSSTDRGLEKPLQPITFPRVTAPFTALNASLTRGCVIGKDDHVLTWGAAGTPTFTFKDDSRAVSAMGSSYASPTTCSADGRAKATLVYSDGAVSTNMDDRWSVEDRVLGDNQAFLPVFGDPSLQPELKIGRTSVSTSDILASSSDPSTGDVGTLGLKLDAVKEAGMSYKLTVTNTAPYSSSVTTVKPSLDATSSTVTVVPGSNSGTAAGSTWNVPVLAPGATASATVTTSGYKNGGETVTFKAALGGSECGTSGATCQILYTGVPTLTLTPTGSISAPAWDVDVRAPASIGVSALEVSGEGATLLFTPWKIAEIEAGKVAHSTATAPSPTGSKATFSVKMTGPYVKPGLTVVSTIEDKAIVTTTIQRVADTVRPTFDITVTNADSDPTRELTMDIGATYGDDAKAYPQPVIVPDNNPGEWKVGALAPAGTKTVRVSTEPSLAPGPAVTTLSAKPKGEKCETSIQCATWKGGDVTVELTPPPVLGGRGQSSDWTLKVSNTSGVEAYGVEVRQGEVSGLKGAVFSAPTRGVVEDGVWKVGDIAPHQSFTATLSSTVLDKSVNQSAYATTLFTNGAKKEVTTVDGSMVKVDVFTVSAGRWRVQVGNSGDSDAGSVKVHFGVSNGVGTLSTLKADLPRGTYENNVWDVGVLPKGVMASAYFSGKAATNPSMKAVVASAWQPGAPATCEQNATWDTDLDRCDFEGDTSTIEGPVIPVHGPPVLDVAFGNVTTAKTLDMSVVNTGGEAKDVTITVEGATFSGEAPTMPIASIASGGTWKHSLSVTLPEGVNETTVKGCVAIGQEPPTCKTFKVSRDMFTQTGVPTLTLGDIPTIEANTPFEVPFSMKATGGIVKDATLRVASPSGATIRDYTAPVSLADGERKNFTLNVTGIAASTTVSLCVKVGEGSETCTSGTLDVKAKPGDISLVAGSPPQVETGKEYLAPFTLTAGAGGAKGSLKATGGQISHTTFDLEANKALNVTVKGTAGNSDQDIHVCATPEGGQETCSTLTVKVSPPPGSLHLTAGTAPRVKAGEAFNVPFVLSAGNKAVTGTLQATGGNVTPATFILTAGETTTINVTGHAKDTSTPVELCATPNGGNKTCATTTVNTVTGTLTITPGTVPQVVTGQPFTIPFTLRAQGTPQEGTLRATGGTANITDFSLNDGGTQVINVTGTGPDKSTTVQLCATVSGAQEQCSTVTLTPTPTTTPTTSWSDVRIYIDTQGGQPWKVKVENVSGRDLENLELVGTATQGLTLTSPSRSIARLAKGETQTIEYSTQGQGTFSVFATKNGALVRPTPDTCTPTTLACATIASSNTLDLSLQVKQQSGDTIVWGVNVTNKASTDATNTVLRAQLEASSLTFHTGALQLLASQSVSNAQYVIPTIGAGKTLTVELRATGLKPEGSNGKVWVEGKENLALTLSAKPASTIHITKAATAQTYIPGQVIQWRVEVKNSGTTQVSGVQVKDSIANALWGSVPVGKVDNNTWSIGTLGAGQSVSALVSTNAPYESQATNVVWVGASQPVNCQANTTLEQDTDGCAQASVPVSSVSMPDKNWVDTPGGGISQGGGGGSGSGLAQTGANAQIGSLAIGIGCFGAAFGLLAAAVRRRTEVA